MSELVWIHKTNANELGISQTDEGTGRGSFILVPVEARKIFFPEKDFSLVPDIDEYIKLHLIDIDKVIDVKYSKPPSKTEHRLSLSGLSQFIGNNKLLSPNKILCFYRKDNIIHFSVVQNDSIYGRLLLEFPVRRGRNNLITKVIFIPENKPDKFKNIPKPFILLAGISGSGKTRFVREQAKITGLNGDNYCLVPVRPDWHEPSDLLGYVSRLSGKSEYIVTDLLKFIVKAWKEIAQAVSFEGKFTKGTEEQLQNVRPFWLCLDEMNLAPVEQYFADYLSILETREWVQDEDGLTYCSDSLLSKNLFSEYSDNAAFKKALGLTEEENDQKLLAFFEENGIPLPFNLIVAGTVNMDETTHGFSRKVLDRALSFDFSEFYPNDFKQFFKKETQPVALTYPYYSSALNLQGELGALSTDELNVTQKSIEFLSQLNQIFENTPFKLAYRALNELLLNVVSFQPKTEAELQAVWDDFLMFKVLPRLEGDTDKLAFDDNDTLLDKLISVLDVQLSLIWDNERVDFLNIAVNGDKIANIKCRSRQKLQWMKSKLESSYFTAFWQ